jgi:hypothetical protein
MSLDRSEVAIDPTAIGCQQQTVVSVFAQGTVNDLQGGEKHDAFPNEAFVLRGQAIVIEAM